MPGFHLRRFYFLSKFGNQKPSRRLPDISADKFHEEILVAGYHLHFLSEDRQAGGHLPARSAPKGLTAQVRHIADFRVSFPETSRFLHADLTRSPTRDLDKAEKKPH